MSAVADRNLLFGILALQNNFIDRCQLLAAFNAWVLDKETALASLLERHKALDAETRALLDALVNRHLAQHDHDPRKSLQALSSNSARRDLAGIADADVQASLMHVAAPRGESSEGPDADPDATISAAETSAGRFVVLRPHAEGGLGQVSVALDKELNRHVALKEIKEKHVASAEARSRFLLEAEITGGLEHPGIVPVYSLGSYADGRPYYAMRFIKGDSLKEAILPFHHPKPQGESSSPGGASPDFQSLEFRKLLGRFVDVCNAIAYAHSRGVLHRDLKPGNIMLGRYGETMVVDWGLAKATARRADSAAGESDSGESVLRPASGSSSSETLPGSALGTPAYMSPEQAAGQIDRLGPASDVYSLGATLYHVLTGKVPFEGDAGAVLKKVQAGDVAPPRQLQPGVPPPLEAVCLRAMSRNAARRYGSARELAEEIERWLADEPVKVWPEPWTVKVRRWTNRHRALVSSAAACLVVALAGSIAGTILLSKANETILAREGETKKANDNLLKANAEIKERESKEKEARDLAEDRLWTATMQLARARFEEHNAGLANELLAQVPAKFRLTPWKLQKNYVQGSLFTLRGHSFEVTSVAFATSGQVLATASGDRTIKLWDARTGAELRILRGHFATVTSVAFAADGQVLASASYDNTVKLWDARTGAQLRTLRGHRDSVTSVAFAADGQVLATASRDETVKLWDARTGAVLCTLRGHTGFVTSVAFATDGQVLASASDDFTVKLWNARTGAELRTLRGHSGTVTSVAFAADGQVLASASDDFTVKLWDARTGAELRTLRGHTKFVTTVAFAADGQVLASASADQTVKLWDARTGDELRTLRGHTDRVTGVAFAADGQVLASASDDFSVKLWDARSGAELRTLRGHTDRVTGVAFAADGQVLASASEDRTVKLWDARTGDELRTLRGHTDRVTSVVFSADGQVLASASYDGTVKLWNARTGAELRTLRGHHPSFLTNVAFAADGQVLASAGSDKTVKLWDARTGAELRTLHGHTDRVTGVAFAADGQVLASASDDRTVKLWDARTGDELRTLRGHTESVESVAFAADGQVLASVSHDGTVKLWNARTGAELRTLRGHTDRVTTVAFSADGQVLASASADQTVKLWDARAGQELRTLRGHTAPVVSVAFAAHGQVLASASQDNTVKLWDARIGAELRTLRGHLVPITSVAFAADSQVLASASWDTMVKLWDVRTGAELSSLRGHTACVQSVAFAADGQVLASASWDTTVRLWDARTGYELSSLRGHRDSVTSVAFAADGQVLASASEDTTVKLWDARTGAELRTLRGHTGRVYSVAFAADGKTLWSRDEFNKFIAWDAATGNQVQVEPPASVLASPSGALSPDGSVFAFGQYDGRISFGPRAIGHDGRILLVPTAIPDEERRFRVWITSPDLHLHRELAEQADKSKQPFALAFRLGRYFAGKHEYASEVRAPVRIAGWLGLVPERLPLLTGLPVHVKTPFHEPAFPDGIACTGVLYKQSGIDPKRLLIGTSRALEGDPSNWMNHAFHGGALYRNGEFKAAQAALQKAAALHGKPSTLTDNLRGLTFLALGDTDKAKASFAAARPAKDAPWEDVLLQRLLQPEIEAALAR